MHNRFFSYLNTAKQIITSYKGEQPLVLHAKSYFSEHKKHGSNDRKFILSLCYAFCRLGQSLQDLPIEEKIKIGFFICNNEPKQYAILFHQNYLENWHIQLNNRIEFVETLYPQFKDKIFPFKDELSEIIAVDKFIESHLIQPNLYLRIRPRNTERVVSKLTKASINYKILSNHCLELHNASKVNEILKMNKEVVVQDFSSQRVQELMELVKQNITGTIHLWDCCAASGGKTILAKDIFDDLRITVSDNRTSIFHNLKKRFNEAGIHHYTSFVADVSKPIEHKNTYNFIVCDVPCSGSGTWSRTPEQIYFYNKKEIANYNQLQFSIASNALKYLDTNGYFLYITCSVFKQENEDVVEKLVINNSIELMSCKYFEGYTQQADTLFAALFKKVK